MYNTIAAPTAAAIIVTATSRGFLAHIVWQSWKSAMHYCSCMMQAGSIYLTELM